MKCPRCRLENPPTAQRCDCGYDFVTKDMRSSYAAPAPGPGGDVVAVARGYSRNHILGQRWAATILDLFLFIVAFFVLARTLDDSDTGLAVLTVGILLYYVVMEAMWGATLGKFATKLRVVDRSGQRPGLMRAIVRTFLRLFEVNPIVAGGIPAGVVALLSPTKQRLGDMLAGTYVLNAADVPRVGLQGTRSGDAA